MTNKDLIEKYLSKTAAKRFLNKVSQHWFESKEKPRYLIAMAFRWDNTTEGFEYWRKQDDLYNKRISKQDLVR